jgi:hypothetical protein
VDVETVLLCDVLPDGTVAATVLVEPVYDTSSGARIGTRTVDPATGAAYTVQGELQQCAAASTCPDCQTHILCDITEVTTPGETPERITNGHFAADASGWTLSGSARYVPSSSPDGSVGFLDLSPDNQAAGSAEQTTTVTPGLTYNLSARIGIWSTGGTTPQSVLVEVLDGSGTVLHSQTVAPVENSGGPQWPADGVVGPVPIVATDTTMVVRFTDQVGGDFIDALLDDVSLLGPGVPGETTTQAQPFMRHVCRDCQGAVTITDTELDGTTVYAVQGTVGTCPVTEDSACASPTTPVTSVGLCLADGTPIAVTVVRDCTGTVTSEGWLNLTSGAYSAGAPPAGTVACGDSRSIQVSGTFCDIDPVTGDVLGLVLIEYTYDDTGAIASVRLVDAVTGGTYTPAGTVTTCPAGVEQPEQDAVVLCDTAADGTVTSFLRDFRRDENGAITGHADYLLDGTAYTPTGTVGVCSSPCLNCETVQLCDVTPGPDEWATVQGQATPETLANGITVTWTRNIPAGAVYPDPNMRSWLPTAASLTSTLSTSKAAQVRIGVSLLHDQTLTLPPGAVIESLSSHHTYDPATRVLTADATSTMSGDKSGGANAGDYITHVYLPRVANSVTFTATAPGGAVGFDNIEASPAAPYPFLRTVCRGCDGTVTSTTDTELDGTTAYTVTGTAGTCQPSDCTRCETLLLCDHGSGEADTIAGAAASGSLSNGVTWTAKNTTGTTAMPPAYNNGDGAWWGLHIFPNASVAPTTWTFSRPSVVEFSVYLNFNANAALNTAQLPAGLEVVRLPFGYTYDAATGVLTRTANTNPGEPCSYVTDPQIETSARFRTPGPVTTYTTAPPPNSRIALCGRFFDYWSGAITVTPSGQFLRTICRDCDGMVTSITDTGLDGVTPYTPVGAVRQCTDPGAAQQRYDVEPLLLCDTAPTGTVTQFLRRYTYDDLTSDFTGFRDTTLDGATPYSPSVGGTVGRCCDKSVIGECTYHLPDTITGFDVSGATFPGCWLGTALNPTYGYGDRVSSWQGTYLSSTGTVSGLGFNSPDLGGDINFSAFTPALPADPAESAPNYVGTAVISGVTVTLRALAGNGLSGSANPTQLLLDSGDRVGVEFSKPVRLTITTTAFADPPTPHNERLCGVVASTVPWDAVKQANCEGVISTVDAATRQPLPATATVSCDDDCCQPVQVCIQQDPEQRIEFISNDGQVYNGTVDPVWKWTPNTNGLPLNDPNFGPAANASWYDMYRPTSYPSTRWTITDTDTNRPAGWITPHPDSGILQSSPPRPGEGPAVPGNADWIGRAQFALPTGADPGSIQIQVTVLNADQFTTGFRLNSGPWQAIADGGFNPTDPPNNGLGVPYVFGPGQIPGAQPGVNTLYMRVRETVGGAAGVIAHMIVTYTIARPEQRSWTRMVCCDGSVYYLDEDGVRQASLPEGWSLIPCGAVTAAPVVLCDDNGSFLRHVSYFPDGSLSVVDTALDGSAYAPTGPVHSCGA